MTQRQNILEDWLGKSVHVVVDRPIGFQHKGLVYPVNYGYIPGVLGGDDEELDVYLMGVDEPVEKCTCRIIGIVYRRNDVEDKLIAAPVDMRFTAEEIAAAIHFQEQYFDSYVLPLFHRSCGVLAWRKEAQEREYLLVFEEFSHKCLQAQTVS